MASYNKLPYSAKFWHLTLLSYTTKLNPSNCLKTIKVYRCMVKDNDHPSKYFRQIFEKSVSIKISPCQNFVLYAILIHNNYTNTYHDSNWIRNYTCTCHTPFPFCQPHLVIWSIMIYCTYTVMSFHNSYLSTVFTDKFLLCCAIFDKDPPASNIRWC